MEREHLVCVIIFGRLGEVTDPPEIDRGKLNRENGIFLSPFAPESLVS